MQIKVFVAGTLDSNFKVTTGPNFNKSYTQNIASYDSDAADRLEC